jgi:Protein of unknown function (DUF4232)
MDTRSGRAWGAVVVLAGSGLVAACSGAAATAPVSVSVPAPVSRPAASAVGRAVPAGTASPACRRSQLVVGGLGISTAAGTSIVTIRVTNVSARSCSVEGRPTVTFLGAAGRALPVAESALAQVQRAVVPLVPHTYSTTAAFVITTGDDMQPGEPCEAVAALRVALPAVTGSFVVGGLSNPDFRYTLCGRGFPAAVSPMAASALIDGYAPAFPACVATQLRAAVAVQGSSARGTRLVVTVTNRSAAVCTVDGYPQASLTGGSGPGVLAYRAGRANALLPAPSLPRPVTLTDGASASAVLATAAPDTRRARCRVWAALSVALPGGGSGALRIKGTLEVCGAAPGAGAFAAARPNETIPAGLAPGPRYRLASRGGG